MKRIISDSFSGMLDLQGIGEGNCDSFFNIHDNIVTIIPLTNDCRKCSHILSYNDGSNAKNHWLYGFSEDGCSVAFLKKTHLSNVLSAPVDMATSKFCTPIIVKSTCPSGVDLRTFDSIEFRSGIIDVLHTPALALKENLNDGSIDFVNKDIYTKSYDVEVNGEKFELTYSISTDDLNQELGKVPDLRTAIHSTMRFDLKTEKPLDDIEKYYSYALNLFQFCAGRLNVGFEMRLYKNETYKGENIANPSPILIKFQDGFDDYSNDTLNITNVIRFNFLGDNMPKLFKLLNEEETQPRLAFLPKRNKQLGNILYTDIGDICVAFEREFSFFETDSNGVNQEYAKSLTDELLDIINSKSDCPESVKKKANDILNTQLKGFSPSLKEKICALYDAFEQNIKPITEQEKHDEYGIAKFYTSEEFTKKISKFVNIRNKASHIGIIWNDGIDLFPHLKLLIYFSILKRTGYSPNESACMLSWLFGSVF